MLAAYFTPESGFSIHAVDKQPLRQDEVRLKVHACGVCGSDRQVVRGEAAPSGTLFPLIMGHEISGLIVEKGNSVHQWQVGDKVIVYPFISCGTCVACKNDQPNLCTRQKCIGYHLPGGFAQEVVVPAGQLVRQPGNCSSAAAALLVDAYATPYHAMKVSQIKDRQTILVIGTGGLGLAALRLAGIFKVGKLGAITSRETGMLTAEKYGAEMCVSTQEDTRTVARKLRRWSSGIDVVIDTVANAVTLDLALNVVRPGGTVTVVGMSEDSISIPIAKTVRRGIKLLASYGSVIDDVHELVDLTEAGSINPSELIAGTVSLTNVKEVFSTVRASGRWVIEPNAN